MQVVGGLLKWAGTEVLVVSGSKLERYSFAKTSTVRTRRSRVLGRPGRSSGLVTGGLCAPQNLALKGGLRLVPGIMLRRVWPIRSLYQLAMSANRPLKMPGGLFAGQDVEGCRDMSWRRSLRAYGTGQLAPSNPTGSRGKHARTSPLLRAGRPPV